MNIDIRIIPHKKQRYPTVGDWYWKGKTLHIHVSAMKDWRSEMLVAVHELVEVLLCKHDGITQKQVDQFDTWYEAQRENKNPKCQGEPGDDVKAPYKRQHNFATAVERMLCAAFDKAWTDYDDQIDNL